MLRRLWHLLRVIPFMTWLGVVGLLVVLLLATELLELAWWWALLVYGLVLTLAGAGWCYRRRRARLGASGLGHAIHGPPPVPGLEPGLDGTTRDELVALRDGMVTAVNTINGSRLGQAGGTAALYELPWYMIIGNPAAGKSSAITHSGLQFPFADGNVVQGVGGTRNCDWFFTTDGIVLDTAGRYSVVDSHHAEWCGFLDLLKKYRPKAPINGVIMAVSIAELSGDDANLGMQLARSLRRRVQDVVERLEVFAPLYIMFTKVDLIAGFADFFSDAERSERERVWGVTLPYKRKAHAKELLAQFDQGFDELLDGLNDMSLASMAQQGDAPMRSGVFVFPLEFAAVRAPLRAFIATLFEENPFQFQPVFRGFYFTSALQEGEPVNASAERITAAYELAAPGETQRLAGVRGDFPAAAPTPGPARPPRQYGYFLLELFSKVIFADKDLVSYYASRTRMQLKYGLFFVAVIVLGCSLGGWSWAYLANRELVRNVRADLDKVVLLQNKRLDLQPRLEALAILQDRIEQLLAYRTSRPWSLRMGLYQGGQLENKLRTEYFFGVNELMVKPVTANLEVLLSEMNANAAQLTAPALPSTDAVAAAPGAAPTPPTVPAVPSVPYVAASPTNSEDAYNALKSYLMLVDKTHAEPSHLNDQMTRYWRGWLEANRGAMPREVMIRHAERLMTFYLTQIDDPLWPRVEPKLALIDTARDNLRRVVRGMPARERVYADIKARAATRFASVTVARIVGEQDQALLVGSHAVAGTFTRAAWDQFVAGAFRNAANGELRSADWVLKSAVKDDLTLEGSPEQIEKGLIDMYKTEYSKEWQKFVRGVTVSDLAGFDGAVQAMNRLGDPQTSPIAKLLTAIYQETAWDNPAVAGALRQQTEKGLRAWFRETVMRRTPSALDGAVTAATQAAPAGADGALRPMGPIGREFAGLARLVGGKDQQASLMRSYMDTLSKLRSRLNQLKNQGDPGPGARQFMQQTLEGSGSELSDALKYVDEQMLTGMADSQKQALRPILVRPLMQTFAVIVRPTEAELNKTWLAQVYEPFQQTLVNKYPFAAASRIEASSAEIGLVFGPDGLIAKYVTGTMGPLVVRRGDLLAARTWADMGITLAPQMVARFPGWIAPLAAGGVASAGAGGGGVPQTVFQIQPLPAPGTLEYTVEIDGQQLRYRNTPAQWSNMVHPAPQGTPGARISAVTFDGRTVDVFNEPGQFGLKRMIDSATKTRKEGGVFELRWNVGGVAVAFDLKITSSPETAGGGGGAVQERGFRGMTLPETVAGAGAVTATGTAVVAQAGVAP